MKDLASDIAAPNDAGATPGQPECKPGAAAELPAEGSPLRYINEAVAAPAEGKSRLMSMADLDRRTASYRETARLIAEIEADLGGHAELSAAERQLAQHGAVMGAILTDLTVQYLKGRRIDPLLFCSVANAQRRLFETLGTRRRPRDVTPSVEEYVQNLRTKG